MFDPDNFVGTAHDYALFRPDTSHTLTRVPRPSQRHIALGFAIFLVVAGLVRFLNSRTHPAAELPGECGDSPNCASSADPRPGFHVDPIPLLQPAQQALESASRISNSLSRWRLISTNNQILHWEVRSRIFGFVDDVHAWIPAGATSLHLRAASRVGYWDLGQNRRHLQEFTDAWNEAHTENQSRSGR